MKKIILLLALAIISCGTSDNNAVSITPVSQFGTIVREDGVPIAGGKILIYSAEEVSLAKKMDRDSGKQYKMCKVIDSTVSNDRGEFQIPEKYASVSISIEVSLGDSLCAFVKEYTDKVPVVLNKPLKYRNSIENSSVNFDTEKNYYAMLEGTPYKAPIVDGEYNFSLLPKGSYKIIIVVVEDDNVINIVVDVDISITLGATDDSQKVTDATLDNSLIAHWSFDQSNSNDEFGKYNGTDFGNIEYVEGIKGMAAKFDGRSYIKTSDIEFNHENYSFEMWVKTDDITTPYGAYDMLSKHGNSSNCEVLIRRERAGGYASETSTNNGFYPMVDENFAGLVNPTGTDYDHIVLSVGEGSANFYVNGVLVDSKENIGETVNNSYSLFMGTWAGNPGSETFVGIMDEVKIYNKALTFDEVREKCNKPRVDAEDLKLLAHWSFNESNSNDEFGKYNGTDFGNIEYVEGIKGMAAKFDGYSYIKTSDIEFDHKNYSFEMWVMTDDIKTPSGAYDMLSKHGNSSNCEVLIRRERAGGYASETSTNNGFYPMVDENFAGLVNPTGTDYDHIVLSVGEGSANFYVNGVLVDSKENIGETVNNSYSLFMGTWAGNPGSETFVGIMDEVKIYNKALTIDEVVELYNK